MLPVLLASCLIAAAGCGTDEPMEPIHVASDAPPIVAVPVAEEFSWGGATIRAGMTKTQVLDQIAVSGLSEYGGQFGIRRPPAEMQTRNEWVLTYGNATGAAPGGGAVRIFFESGEVSGIVHAAVFAMRAPCAGSRSSPAA